MNRETWYVLEDGSCGDPAEVTAGPDGRLRHRDGRAVAYAPHGPRSRGVDAEAERAKAKAMAAGDGDDAAGYADREAKPERPKRAYKTRESKAAD